MYLSKIIFPTDDRETDFIWGIRRTCYDSYYPFRTLAINGLTRIDFAPVTILYGGNGSGKSTALNVIAEKISARRDSVFNRTNFYEDYVKMCEAEIDAPDEIRIITSDDVFDYMLNIRNLNEGIDSKREEVFKDYLNSKYSKFQMQTMADYEQIRKVVNSRRKTQSRYVRDEMPDNIREYSNGESAFKYFTEKISENGLYILDEPENSLSPKRQLELAQFIQDSARFFNCQIIMSTHSPFLLALKDAKIYNLDENPVTIKKWTDLENVRAFYEFFEKHREEFQ
ncbi:MAG: AAA family ATPase [Clostridiales bacterium]|jgi:predicted ATPase|nr:AAA family ATPase [Clostridiales bacterium]